MATPNSNPAVITAVHQIDTLVEAIDRHETPACIGIDPVFDRIPRSLRLAGEIESIEEFSLGVLDAIAGMVPAVKPQSACFERYGSKGYAILEKVVGKARDLGFVVILDAKRGDIGSSAQHYAKGAADMGAHFITVSPYMGPSSIEPFIDAGLGVFALARTSNPDSDVIQTREMANGKQMVHLVSAMIAAMGKERIGDHGLSSIGAVVGATKAASEMGILRSIMPNQIFLVPGVGAQGGTVDDVRPMCRKDAMKAGQLGVIVNASRAVLYPESTDGSWLNTIHVAASRFSNEMRTLVP